MLNFSTNFLNSHRTQARVLPFDRARRELLISICLEWCIKVWDEETRDEGGAGLVQLKLTLDFFRAATLHFPRPRPP